MTQHQVDRLLERANAVGRSPRCRFCGRQIERAQWHELHYARWRAVDAAEDTLESGYVCTARPPESAIWHEPEPAS